MSRVPYYILYNRYTNELSAFQNVAGHYQALELTEPRLWLADAELGLGLWQGTYQEIERLWLRWYDAEGNWLATPTEQERRRVEQ